MYGYSVYMFAWVGVCVRVCVHLEGAKYLFVCVYLQEKDLDI